MQQEQELGNLLHQLRQQPDPDLFAQLYDYTSPTVYAWARALTPTPAAAEQTVVSTYFQLWRDAACYPDRGHPWHRLLTHTLTAAGNQTTSD